MTEIKQKSELFGSFNQNMNEFTRVAARKFHNAMRQGMFAVRHGAIDGMNIANGLATQQIQPVRTQMRRRPARGERLAQ